MEAALADGADLADTSLESNRSYTWQKIDGDIDAAFDGAAHVTTRRFIQQRLIPLAIETAVGGVRSRRRSRASTRCGRRPRSRTSCG